MATTSNPAISESESTAAPTLLPEPGETDVLLDAVPGSVGMAECLMLLSELLDVDLAFTAERVEVGRRRLIEQTDMGVPVVYRELRFEGTEPIIPTDIELAADAVLTTPEAAVFDVDVFAPTSLIDFDQLADLSDMLVLGLFDAGGEPVVRVVVAERDGEVTAAGSCTGLVQYVAGGLAEEMGRGGPAGTIGLITDWVAADPAERADYAVAETAWTEEATVPDDPGG